jgi:hypothetical protein
MSKNELCISTSNDRVEFLVERARTLMENARSAATRSGYARDFADYDSFCRAHALPALPLSSPVIALYLAEFSTRMRPATIARRMAAIADATKRGIWHRCIEEFLGSLLASIQIFDEVSKRLEQSARISSRLFSARLELLIR